MGASREPFQTNQNIRKMIKYSDGEIAEYVAEPKPIPGDLTKRLQKMRSKRGHLELNLDLIASSGNRYRLIIRQNKFNHLDFSVILALIPPGGGQAFRLRRYNGKHPHCNILEKTYLHDYHIHMATEKYQACGAAEDAYAEVSAGFCNLQTALQSLLADCNFQTFDAQQPGLFEEDD